MYCKSYPNVILQLLLPAVSPCLFKDTVLVKEIEFGNDLVGIIPFRGISSPSSCGRRSFGSSWKNERWMWRLSVLRCSPAYQVVFSGLRPMDLKNGGRTLQSSFLASSGLSQFLTPYFLLKADHAVPDAGTGGSKLLPEFFLLLYEDRSIRVENTARFLAVVGVGEVIARFSVCLADAFVHVVDVIVLLGGGIELSALAIWLVVMEPHEHVRRCHRLSARRLPCSKDGLEGNQVSPP